ncbi:hypothetical protein [Saccharothrix sp.]|uniref:hypothetical protein n=1 Tax=Saccharothrix sp. TaxID=1873460 RepID=UPI0028115F4C|nr:hypothetical protein [Saccharothrix sp.]
MTHPRVAAALAAYPSLDALADLIREDPGWRFITAVIGEEECLYGMKEDPPVTETITLRSPEAVTVVRLRTEDSVVRRGRPVVLWEFTGEIREAIAALRELPPHGHPLAPKLLRPASLYCVGEFVLGGRSSDVDR